MRLFNTAGPIRREEHYHLPPLDQGRLDADEVRLLIRQRKYFALHAPRQTGKTSALLELRDELNSAGEVRCVYVNVEVGQTAREDVTAGMRAILSALASEARHASDDEWLAATWPGILERSGPHDALRETLTRWAESEAKPLVLLIDEIDALVGDTLLAVLRQLRAGYPERPRRFPQSVVLCGVRDYRIRSGAENAIVAGGSAFNVRAASLRLGDFSQADVESLLTQHTAETGQAFTAEARAAIWDLTQGQPWLVNALAYEAGFDNKAGRDRPGDPSRPARGQAARGTRVPRDRAAAERGAERRTVHRRRHPLRPRPRSRAARPPHDDCQSDLPRADPDGLPSGRTRRWCADVGEGSVSIPSRSGQVMAATSVKWPASGGGRLMTTLTIELPDELAEETRTNGLLAPGRSRP